MEDTREVKTLHTRTRVKRDVALEKLLTEIASETFFNGMSTSEVVDAIIYAITIDGDTRSGMIAFLDDKRGKPYLFNTGGL